MRTFIASAVSLAWALVSFSGGAAETTDAVPPVSKHVRNKDVVRKFYDLAFNQHRPKEAALAYLTEGYVQHNPHVATGRAAFIAAFAAEAKDGAKDEAKNGIKDGAQSTAEKAAAEKDESRTIFKRFIAEGDLVVLHSHKIARPGDRGTAGIDIFRLENGKIAEHWDVNQPIPETAKNSNTMF